MWTCDFALGLTNCYFYMHRIPFDPLVNTGYRYVIHSPYFTKTATVLQNAWKEMEKVQKSGKAKAIGVLRFLQPHMEAILEVAEIQPVANQIGFHPYLQRAGEYVPWLQQQGIAVRRSFWAGSCHPRQERAARRAAGQDCCEAQPVDVSESAVLIRWHLNEDVISISITTKPERIQEYFQVLDLQLSEVEMKERTEIGLTHTLRSGCHSSSIRMSGHDMEPVLGFEVDGSNLKARF